VRGQFVFRCVSKRLYEASSRYGIGGCIRVEQDKAFFHLSWIQVTKGSFEFHCREVDHRIADVENDRLDHNARLALFRDNIVILDARQMTNSPCNLFLFLCFEGAS